MLEDIGMMKMLPGMTVINTCDYNQTKAATIAIAEYEGPVYLRFGRPSVPNFTPVDGPYEIGKAWLMEPGEDVTILATGHLVWEALEASGTLVVTHNGAPLAALVSLDPDHYEEDLAALRRARAQRALQTLQSAPKPALSAHEIESEIKAVRKARA